MPRVPSSAIHYINIGSIFNQIVVVLYNKGHLKLLFLYLILVNSTMKTMISLFFMMVKFHNNNLLIQSLVNKTNPQLNLQPKTTQYNCGWAGTIY